MEGLEKNEKQMSLFDVKSSFRRRYLNICPNSFAHMGKRPHKKSKVTFKIYDVKDWETNNYNKHISQCLKKYRRPGNETKE